MLHPNKQKLRLSLPGESARQPSLRQQSPRLRRAKKSSADDLFEALFGRLDDQLLNECKPPDAAMSAQDTDPDDSAGGVKLTQVVQLLRKEREAQGLSLGDIHEATGITQGRLSRIENRVETNPTIGTLERIAEALGLQLLVTVVELEQQEEPY